MSPLHPRVQLAASLLEFWRRPSKISLCAKSGGVEFHGACHHERRLGIALNATRVFKIICSWLEVLDFVSLTPFDGCCAFANWAPRRARNHRSHSSEFFHASHRDFVGKRELTRFLSLSLKTVLVGVRSSVVYPGASLLCGSADGMCSARRTLGVCERYAKPLL